MGCIPMVYPAWTTADPRIIKFAEWLHDRDHQSVVHEWENAPLDERVAYCTDSYDALRFLEAAVKDVD